MIVTRKAFFTKETQRISGTWVKQGTDPGSYEAFVPAPLPPEPPVQLDPSLANKLQKEVSLLDAWTELDACYADLKSCSTATFERKLCSQVKSKEHSLRSQISYYTRITPRLVYHSMI